MPSMIGDNLKKLRLEYNWTQKQIADMFHIKRQTWASYEKGNSFPDANLLVQLANRTNRSIDSILGLVEKHRPVINLSQIHNDLEKDIAENKWIRIKNLPNSKPENNIVSIFNKNYEIELYNPFTLLKEKEDRIYLNFLNCYDDDAEIRNANFYDFIKKFGILGVNFTNGKAKYFVKDYLSIYNDENNEIFDFWKEIYKGSMTSMMNPYEEFTEELNSNISNWLNKYDKEDVYFEDLNNYIAYYNQLNYLIKRRPKYEPSEDINVLICSRLNGMMATYTYGSLMGLMKLEILSDMENDIFTNKCYHCGKHFISRDLYARTCADCLTKIIDENNDDK